MRKILSFLALASLIVAGVILGADSAGVWGPNGMTDTETNKPAHLKLRDNLDGTKSLVVFSVQVTPSPTYTPTATATSTATFTPTATATNTATPTPTP